MGRLNPSCETKFSGTYGDRGIFVFPIQLTTSRIGNLTWLIHTLLYVMTIHTCIHTYKCPNHQWYSCNASALGSLSCLLVMNTGVFIPIKKGTDPYNDWGRGRGCNKFVPVWGGNGTKLTPTSNAMKSGQVCQPCRGPCSPIPGRGCFGDLPGDETVVSPPSPIVQPLIIQV